MAGSFTDVFCIVFHKYNFGEIKISDGMKFFHSVLKKHRKCFFLMCGNHDTAHSVQCKALKHI